MIGTLLDTLRIGTGSPGPEPVGPAPSAWAAPPRGLSSLIGYEGAALWLYRRLRATGALDLVEPEFRGALTAAAREAAAIGLRIDEETASVVQRLAEAGIPVVLIKGVARRALAGRYPYLDARATHDVDLLLPEDRLAEAFALLRRAGYEEAKPGVEARHHLAPLWNERRVSVELHGSTSLRIPPALAWERATRGGLAVEWNGCTVRTPAPTELAWHAVQHAVSLSSSVVQGFRLLHFLEVAALVGNGAPLDWARLRARIDSEPAVDRETERELSPRVTARWFAAALALVREPPLELFPTAPFDLAALLGWRLRILGARSRLGEALTHRLLEEGPRSLAGAPLQGAPRELSWPKRLRRPAAGGMSRLLFRAWRTVQRW